MLKKQLKAIKENECRPIDGDITLLPDMLDHIGDVDDELRDDLIYPILATWIMNDLDEDIRLEVLDVCLNNLNFGLGELGTDTVFTRTFSVLQVPVFLYTHLEKPFIPDDRLTLIVESVLQYLQKEQDLRGFVSGKGWAHAVAHSADALKYIAKLDNLSKEQVDKILTVMKEKMLVSNYNYINDEDERMVLALVALMDKIQDIKPWIESFADLPKKQVLPDDLIVQLNAKQFLRSLYFRVDHDGMKRCIQDTLDKLDRYK